MVARLGAAHAVPVEVLACGARMLERALRDELSLESSVRRDDAGRVVKTDDMNPVLDVRIGDLEPEDLDGLAAWLEGVPGVVGHGLFLEEGDALLVEDGSGRVEEIERQE